MVFLGIFAFFVAALDVRKNVGIVLPSVSYILLIILSVNQTDVHGWYLIPLYPFLSIAGARALVDAIERKRATYFFFAVIVGVQLINALYTTPFGMTPAVYRFFLVSIILAAYAALRFRRVGRAMTFGYLIGTAITTILYVHPA
jgi:hypothetical protein